jgi:outer membrane translocation and assembly module TamA
MVPPAGLNRVSMDVFMDGGSAWDDAASQRYFKSAGIELLSEVRVGYQLGAQLRAGVARGLETPGRTTWYLHIGRSF